MIILGNLVTTGEPQGIRLDDLLRHLYILGKTGSGKSTVLSNVLCGWFSAGHGGCLIDPHGDLADEVLQRLPRKSSSGIVVIDPSDEDRPVAWNPLWRVPAKRRSAVAQGLVSAFRGVWRDSWGPRMEYILLNALRLLLDAEEETLLGLPRLLVEPGYRRRLMKTCHDPVVVAFWRREFDAWDERFRREAIAPIQNKIGQFLGDPNIRRILGQRSSRLDLRISMDQSRILVVSLAKGLIGEGSANLFGSLLVASLHEAALSRAELSEERREPFLLAVDEFQSVVTDRFASALAEARKYGLGLVLGNQYLDQLIPELRSAVLGNVGSMILFRMGGADAETFARELGNDVSASRFCDLSTFRAMFVTTQERGILSASLIRTLPPVSGDSKGPGRLRRRSAERFGRDGGEVDDAIRRWMDRRFR